MAINRILGFIFLLSCLSQTSFAQNFEWLKTYGEKNSDYVLDFSPDADGGLTFISQHDGGAFKVDTFHFDTVSVVMSKINGTNFLLKQDSNGKVKMIRKIGYLKFDANMCKDKAGNYYLTGHVQDSVLVDSLKFFKSNGTMIFMKYDKNFKLIWATQTGFKNTTSLSLTFSEDHIYFTAVTADTSKVGTTTYISQTQDYIFGEINKIDGSVIWSKRLITGSTRFRITSLVSLKGNLYVAGDFDITSTSSPTSVIINKDTLWGPGGFVLQTDTLGNYKRSFNFHNKKNLRVNCISTDGEYLYIGGNFADTLLWGNKKIPPSFVMSGSQGDNEHFAASLTAALQPRWFYHPKIVIKGGNNSVLSVTTSLGYIYFGSIMAAKSVVINGDTLRTAANADVLLFKTDFLGNILWATIGGSTNKDWIVLRTMDVTGKSVFAAGYYYGTIQLGGFKDTTRGYDGDCWITKISDYSITRGKVKSGPYCAGDTLLIPYTKFGDFDTSNTFIAQLSDDEGNFESGYRELGRLKSNKDGTIIGKLPLFKVSSSLNYRIRILSTKPAVQSYYRRDSLQLLIYSRDKADPGKPETICKGDTIKLNTYGGTKWIWSPKYRMDDSTKREPRVWPQITTTYKIIIADSSGCGQPDTAFKQIIVRQPLKVTLGFKDTAICDNYELKFPGSFDGGDSANYRWQWYFVASPKSWFATLSGKLKSKDTLVYTPAVDANTSEKLAVVLKDGCTAKADTAYVTIRLKKQISLISDFKDTVLCYGNPISWKAHTTGIDTNVKWQWKDMTKNAILSLKDSLSLSATQTTKIKLTLNNGCKIDSNEFTVYVNPPLKASLLTNKGNLRDTVLCFGRSLKIYSTGKGGINAGYKFNWYLNQSLFSTSDTIELDSKKLFTNSGGTKILTLTLADNCTSGSDSVSRRINVIAGPQANFSWTKTCNKTKVPFTFTGSLAALPVTTKYSWHYPDGDSSVIQNPSKLLSKVGKNQVSLILRASNGCSDALTKEVDVKQEAIAQFTAADVCEDSAVNFINTSQDAMEYEWKFGDGQSDNSQSPKHLYLISGVTGTFNVTLIASVPAGCSDTFTGAVTINANPKSDFNFTTGGNQVNFTAVEIGASNYQWTFGDGGTSNTTTQTTQYTYSKFPSGKYTACLKVSNIAGCNSQTCKEINITGASNPMIKQQGIKIYPNPNTGSFTVETNEAKGNLSIEIYNAIGQMVHKVETFQSSTALNLKLAEGIYLVRVKNESEVYLERVVIGR